MKHHETLLKHCETLLKHCETSQNTRTLTIRCDDIGARCGDIGAPCLRRKLVRSFRRYGHGVSVDIGDCRVGITLQMCNRVTIHGDMPLWNFSFRNRVTPVSIQDGVQQGITFAAILTIPAAPSPISAELSPIPEAIGGRRCGDADRCATL